MTLLLLRNLVFTILQPGVVVVLIPYLILKQKISEAFNHPFQWFQYSGALFFTSGMIVTLICILSLAFMGKGTLSPAYPTKQLVVKGLYRYSRNPMYVGVMAMLVGESLFFQSSALLIYLMIVFLFFNIYIINFEEPRLRRDFPESYSSYLSKVRRWI